MFAPVWIVVKIIIIWCAYCSCLCAQSLSQATSSVFSIESFAVLTKISHLICHHNLHFASLLAPLSFTDESICSWAFFLFFIKFVFSLLHLLNANVCAFRLILTKWKKSNMKKQTRKKLHRHFVFSATRHFYHIINCVRSSSIDHRMEKLLFRSLLVNSRKYPKSYDAKWCGISLIEKTFKQEQRRNEKCSVCTHTHAYKLKKLKRWGKILDFLLYSVLFFSLLASRAVHFTMFNFHLIGRSVDILAVVCGSVFMFFIRCLSRTHTIAPARIACVRGERLVLPLDCVQPERDKRCVFIFVPPSVTHTDERQRNSRWNTCRNVCRNSASETNMGHRMHAVYFFRWDIFLSSLFRFVVLAMFSQQFSMGHFQSAVFYLWVIHRCCSLYLCEVFFSSFFPSDELKLCTIAIICALDTSR